MTKVKISSPGIDVEIEADGTVDELAERALKLFNDAGGWPQHRPGPSGFAETERRYSDDARGPIAPVGWTAT